MRKEKGITLVALVVTIIVLIILSGVTLGLILEDNGLILKASNAKKEWLNTQEKENQELANLEERMEEIGNGYSGNIIDFGEGKIQVPFDGKGTQKNPYKIYKVSELAYIAMLVNYGVSFEGYYFELANDLNINPNKYTIDEETNTITFTEDAKQWIPIGTESSPFKGTFDGTRHTIKGVYIDNSLNYQSLFGNISGTIKNLNVEESYVKCYVYGAGVVGNNDGIIENCYSKVIVKTTYRYGGGICGRNNGLIKCCYNESQITSAESSPGGIVGYNQKDVMYCYNLGTMIAGPNDSSNAYSGGICGNAAESTSNIRYCYNIGSITKTGGTNYLGGIVGISTYGNVYDSYSSVLSKIVGRHYEGTGKTQNCAIKTEAEIRSESFIELIGGSEYWKFDAEKQLVILKWQDEKPKDYTGSNPEIIGNTIDFWDGKILVPFGGNGTQTNPYEIDEISDLEYLRMLVNYGLNLEGTYFKLINDLNINTNKYTIDEETNTITFGENAKQWIPIGNEIAPFNGIFDGNGKIIKGLYISNTLDSQGLFGYNAGNIKGLNINESYIKGKSCNGSICGTNLENGIVEQCGTGKNTLITGTSAVAGIVGYNQSGGVVERCYNLAKVTASTVYTGGIVGTNYNIVKYCYNLGSITSGKNSSSNAYAGGIAGYNAGTVQYTYNMGSISRTAGEAYLGGIVGQSSSGKLYDSYSSTASKVIGRNYPSAGTTTNASIKGESEIRSESFIDLIGGSDYWKFDTEKQLVILKWQ